MRFHPLIHGKKRVKRKGFVNIVTISDGSEKCRVNGRGPLYRMVSVTRHIHIHAEKVSWENVGPAVTTKYFLVLLIPLKLCGLNFFIFYS